MWPWFCVDSDKQSSTSHELPVFPIGFFLGFNVMPWQTSRNAVFSYSLSPPAFWRYAHKPEEGRPTALRDTFALTTSLSVLDIATAVCFLLNAVSGKYVLGPTRTNKQPLVDRLSYSPAWSASANSQSLHSLTLSPMKALCLWSRVELM